MRILNILIFILIIAIFSYGGGQLQPLEMKPLPLGSIKAEGWLKNQLRIQADGLSGHLDEFWPDIKNSGWFGGNAEGWERAPYWLDGVIPLAYTLDDPQLIKKVRHYIEIILDCQYEDGWLGPREENYRNHDLWSLFLTLKMLSQYQEASSDERITIAIEKCLRKIDGHIGAAPLRNWAMYRWFETLIPIYWLYEQNDVKWLLDLALKLRSQGFDWGTFFEQWPLIKPTPKGRWNFMGHVVNNAMALKANALWWRQTGKESDRNKVYAMLRNLDEYHGMVSGVFSGDECLAGKNPSQGTELCAVVEYMYSLEILLSVLGDPFFADRLEKITFNALPATFSPDMWSHQYDQQVNQVECSVRDDRLWTTNGPESNIFGLEPNYGCCTSNLSQGWPKFAAHLWMTTKDGGIAAVAYAPNIALIKIKGTDVELRLKTDYPFRDKLTFTVKTQEPIQFALYLRIPKWTQGPSILIADDQIFPEAGSFHKVERQWSGTTELVLTLPMRPVCTRRYNNAIAIERGPLVYALKIGEKWKAVNQDREFREAPHGDWEVHPVTAWNYALDVSDENPEQNISFSELPIGHTPFSPDGAPIIAKVKGARLPQWQMVNGSAGEIPKSPVTVKGEKETLTLIPYGCTNLRITEFPTIKRISKDQRMAWWREAKFGMFIHWGLYALPAGIWDGKEIEGIGEWIMAGADIPRKQYEKLADRFNPVKFDAQEWVNIAKKAGMKYLVITSKHHDGFSIFDSKISKYDIVDATKYKKDVLQELSQACREAAIEFCTYYSILDWHHPSQEKDIFTEKIRNGYARNNMIKGKKESYIEYMKTQLQEIIIQYDSGILWFDGGWTDWWTPDDGRMIMDFLWSLKPQLIINNRAAGSKEMELVLGDYLTPEQFIPEQGAEKDWESCMTMNDTWGFKKNDHNWKSTKVLLVNLVDVVSKGGNLLLNVGPTAEGLIPQPSIKRLREMGEWLAINGEAIYGTKMWHKYKEGPHDVITDYYDDDLNRDVVFTAEDFRFTSRNNTIYAICLGWPDKMFQIKNLGKKSLAGIEIRNVSMLGCQIKLKWNQTAESLEIEAPAVKPCRHAFTFKIVIQYN
jgi:alpha-L-fucosidase